MKQVMTLAQEKALGDAYDLITSMFNKQKRIVSFEDCYGDGTRFPLLTEKGVSMLWRIMVDLISKNYKDGYGDGYTAALES